MGRLVRSGTGFTLAEVLITLGIIGIVAALTIPNLLANYRKTVTVNKVKKFYSMMSQATNASMAENGPMGSWDGFTSSRNAEEMKHWFDKYLKPYIKVNDEWIGHHYPLDGTDRTYNVLFVALADGSVMSVTNWAAEGEKDANGNSNHNESNFNGLIHVNYYTDAKAINEGFGKPCVNVFTFLFYSKWRQQYFFQPYSAQVKSADEYNRDFFFEQLNAGNTQYCALIMMTDGWQIKDAYPWK